MKRIAPIVFFLALGSLAFAGVTATQTRTWSPDNQYEYLNMEVTASTTGLVATSWPIDGEVEGVETKPDASTPPTNAYDLTVTDDYGYDIMGGALADRSSTAAQYEAPKVGGSSPTRHPVLVLGTLTVNVSGNTESGGKFKLRIKIKK